MGEKKVATKMAIKVDLSCDKCCTKIKRILCGIPQVQDRIFNEEDNIVIIKVVCCTPEKIKKTICNRGGKTVKSIEILADPSPPQPTEQPKEAPPPPAEKPNASPPPKPKSPPPPPVEKPKSPPPPAADKPKSPPPPESMKIKSPGPVSIPVPVPVPAPIPVTKPAPPPPPAPIPEEEDDSESDYTESDYETESEPEPTPAAKPPPIVLPPAGAMAVKPPEAPKAAVPEPVIIINPSIYGSYCRECSEGRGGCGCWARSVSAYGVPQNYYCESYGIPVYERWDGGPNRVYPGHFANQANGGGACFIM